MMGDHVPQPMTAKEMRQLAQRLESNARKIRSRILDGEDADSPALMKIRMHSMEMALALLRYEMRETREVIGLLARAARVLMDDPQETRQ
jgi:hypothetical protein